MTNTGTIRNKGKMIFFIIGSPGTGKTVLAAQLKEKLVKYKKMLERDVIIFDDVYHGINRKRDNYISQSIVGVRHLEQNVIICSSNIPSIKFSFRENPYITWIFTNINESYFDDLSYYLHLHLGVGKKLQRQWQSYIYKKRKTRPYLLLTLDGNKNLHYEFHRYKLKVVKIND